MKLAKLSLAAIMVAGAFSVANATPLEDAIKGVDLSGFLRYRVYSDESATTTTERHRFSSQFSFTMPVADNLKANATFEFEGNDYPRTSTEGAGGENLTVQQLWFKYATSDYCVKFGKQALNTPLTYNYYSPHTGDGVRAMYTGVKGWTFAAAAFADSKITSENIYALAVIGSFGPVNAQLWGLKVSNMYDSMIFFQVDGKFAGVSLKGQYVTADPADSTLDRASFYGVQAGYAMDNFNVGAGYTKTADKNNGTTSFSADDQKIQSGMQIYGATSNAADATSAFITAGASFGKFGVGAGYTDASIGSNDGTEYYLKASYTYSKNFGANVYYSDMNWDDNTMDNKEIRFEAKYKF